MMDITQQVEQLDTKKIKNVRVLITGSDNNKEIATHLNDKGWFSHFIELEESLKDVTTNFSLKHLQPAISYANQKETDLIIGVDQATDKICIAVKNKNNKFQLLSPHQLAAIMVYQRINTPSERPLLIAKSIHISEMIDKMLLKEDIDRVDFLTDPGTIKSKVKELSELHEPIAVLAFTENQEIVDSRNNTILLLEEIMVLAGRLKDEGKSLFDLMVKLYRGHGFYKEKTFVLDFTQNSQKENMLRVMEHIRRKNASILETLNITHLIDYKKGISVNLLSKKSLPVNFPSQNILHIKLADGTSVTFVPQTDKMYFYISIRGINFANDEFEENDRYLNEKILKVVQTINKL